MNKIFRNPGREPDGGGPAPADQTGYVAANESDIEAVNPEVQAEVEYFFWQLRQKQLQK